MPKPTFIIYGTAFTTLEEFARYFTHLVLTDFEWNGNFDAFNDILRGVCGTPEGGFILHWRHSAISRERLGLIRPADGRSRPVFDILIEIIKSHGAGGEESDDGVELYLD